MGIQPVLTTRKSTGWHGTSPAIACIIEKTGFDLTFASKDSWLGPGVYFYVDWDGQSMASAVAAAQFAQNHRACTRPAIIRSELEFQYFFEIHGENRDFYNKFADLVVKAVFSTNDPDLMSRFVNTNRRVNAVLGIFKLAYPDYDDRIDGIGNIFDGTPEPGQRHAIIAVRRISCILSRLSIN